MIALAALEEVIDVSGAAPRIEAVLPAGARPRQLSVRTLLLGMMIAIADSRPAHLPRVHQALTALPEKDKGQARHRRGLEARTARADLPADRVHLQPGHQGAGQGRARRAALRPAAAHLR